MITLVLLGIAGAAPLVARRLTRDLFPPTAIVLSTWCGTLGLATLQWLRYVPISAGAWTLLAQTVALLAVTTAASTWAALRLARPPAAVAAVGQPARWVQGYAVLSLAGLAWYVATVVPDYGWAIFLRGNEVRGLFAAGSLPSRYLFLQQFSGAGALLAWGLWLAGAPLGRWGVAAGFVAAAGTLVTTDRTQFFSLALAAAFMFLIRRGPELRTGRLVTLAAAAIVALVANFLVIGAWTAKRPDQVSIRLRSPGDAPGSVAARLVERLQPAAVVYFYATGAYPALSEYLSAPHPRTGGAHVVFPIARFLQRAGVLEGPLPAAIPPFVAVGTREDGLPLATNSYTFLYYPLEDFGRRGALAYAAVVGLVCGWVYGWAGAARTSPVRLLVAGQVSMALALSTFVNRFNSTAWWYVLVLTLLPFAVARASGHLQRTAAGGSGPMALPGDGSTGAAGTSRRT